MFTTDAQYGLASHVDRGVGSCVDEIRRAGPVVERRRQTQVRSEIPHLMLKRALDVTLSLGALLLLLPLFVFLCIFIPLESRGSPFFSQLRWGRGGRKIRVYKFRTMRSDMADPTGVAQTVFGDRRVTRLGHFLRKSSIDELPQLLNILLGHMSLVGPRCHPVGMLAGGMLYEELVPVYHQRHRVRPGLTGLAQMRGLRGPTTNADLAKARIACDLHYIRSFSIWLDLRIIFGTVVAELKGGRGS